MTLIIQRSGASVLVAARWVPLAFGAAFASACSEAVSDSPGPDAGNHPSTHVAADSGCARPVWQSTDTGFTYAISGGYARLPPDAGCSALQIEYDFAIASGQATLVERGCLYDGPVNVTVTLTAAQTAQIVAALGNLYTVCSGGCGADASNISLTIGATTYDSNFYAGCGTGIAAPPYIGFNQLTDLGSTIDGIVSAACEGDAGGAGGAGACVAGPIDGG
jgi:hypothetical protein